MRNVYEIISAIAPPHFMLPSIQDFRRKKGANRSPFSDYYVKASIGQLLTFAVVVVGHVLAE
jgi:hypothetical protein